jgi:hypothetical protein
MLTTISESIQPPLWSFDEFSIECFSKKVVISKYYQTSIQPLTVWVEGIFYVPMEQGPK